MDALTVAKSVDVASGDIAAFIAIMVASGAVAFDTSPCVAQDGHEITPEELITIGPAPETLVIAAPLRTF